MKNKLIRDLKKPISLGEAIILIVIGLLMGTVFTFGMHYWEAPVTRSEAIFTEATYKSYKKTYNKHGLNEVILRFSDLEQQSIDGTCLSEALLEKLELLSEGTKLGLVLHPNSSTVLELTVHGEVWLHFEESQSKLHHEVTGFTVLGIFCYMAAAGGAIKILRKEIS